MTSTRDFHVPARASTLPVQRRFADVQDPEAQGAACSPNSPPLSGVNLSRSQTLSLQDSRDTLHRRPTRSNTIRTYHEPTHPSGQAGAEPGIDPTTSNDPPQVLQLHRHCSITVVEFSPERVEQYELDNDSLGGFISKPRDDWVACRWINVNGLSWDVIKILGNEYHLHRLAIEDLIMLGSRTKADWYSHHAFIVLTLQKLVHVPSDSESESESEDGCEDKHRREEARKQTKSFVKKLLRRRRRQSSSEQSNSRDTPGDSNDPTGRYSRAHNPSSPIAGSRVIRTLQRYRGGPNQERIEFLERHSALVNKNLVVSVEQVAIFLMGDNTVISFFERSADDIEPLFSSVYGRRRLYYEGAVMQACFCKRSSTASSIYQSPSPPPMKMLSAS